MFSDYNGWVEVIGGTLLLGGFCHYWILFFPEHFHRVNQFGE